MAGGERLGLRGVDQHEVGDAGLEVGVDVGGVGLELQPPLEVAGGQGRGGGRGGGDPGANLGDRHAVHDMPVDSDV